MRELSIKEQNYCGVVKESREEKNICSKVENKFRFNVDENKFKVVWCKENQKMGVGEK